MNFLHKVDVTVPDLPVVTEVASNNGNETKQETEAPFLGPWLDFRSEFTSFFKGMNIFLRVFLS